MNLLKIPHDVLAQKLAAYIAADPAYKAVYAYTKQRFETAMLRTFLRITGRMLIGTP